MLDTFALAQPAPPLHGKVVYRLVVGARARQVPEGSSFRHAVELRSLCVPPGNRLNGEWHIDYSMYRQHCLLSCHHQFNTRRHACCCC